MTLNNLPVTNSTHTMNTQKRWFGRLRSPEVLLIGSAILVGTATGLSAIVFIWLLAQIGSLARWVEINSGGPVGILIFMALAGLLVGFMIDLWGNEVKGGGVPEVMEAIALRGGRIRRRVAVGKIFASSVTIGAGGSAGREGPIVQVGAAIGSAFGQYLHFSEERMRTLVACGAAAGIAAAFNAPIAGSIFALEVILGRLTVRYFGAVVISAVSASVVAQQFLGNQATFQVPAYRLNHLGEIPIYILLGILSALWAVLFIRLFTKVEGGFERWQVPVPVKAAVGMVLTGLVSLLLTDRAILGSGLHMIESVIARDVDMTLQLMLGLLLLKLVATTFTLGSGNSGGAFAPSLFMGALLGGFVGSIAHILWPEVAVHPGAYAIVGMAAVFSGAARAPMTAVLIVFEMSNDYQLILPLMLATVLSTLLAELLFKDSIYTLKLSLKGIQLDRGRDEDVLQGVSVHEVMFMRPVTIDAHVSVEALLAILSQTHFHGLPVLEENGRLWGIVTISDIDRVQNMTNVDLKQLQVADIGTSFVDLSVAYADEAIGDVLARMSQRGYRHFPVVAREDTRQLVGLINREAIIRAYNVGLVRRADTQHRAKRLQLRNVDGTEFIEITLTPEHLAVGENDSGTFFCTAPRLCLGFHSAKRPSSDSTRGYNFNDRRSNYRFY